MQHASADNLPRDYLSRVPPAHSGARLVLVAKFNQRYHRTGCALRDTLTAMGTEVVSVEERTRGLDALLGRPLESRLESALHDHRPDLVLVFKGASLAPESIARLRGAAGARWVNWFPDGPHLLDLSLRIGAAYDRCFIFDTSMVERHRALGHDAEYLAEGFDPAFHRPLSGPGAAAVPMAFVGSHEPFRARALEAVRDLGLVAWGPGWPRGPLYGEDFVRAFSTASIGINIHQFFGDEPSRGRYGTGANRRVFELAGIGTAQLCDAKADLARSFADDREIVTFTSPAELREKAAWLLGAPGERAKLAERARNRALAEHTWHHRLEMLLARALG
jgi:spore maturation protein CgeB